MGNLGKEETENREGFVPKLLIRALNNVSTTHDGVVNSQSSSVCRKAENFKTPRITNFFWGGVGEVVG